MQSTNEPSTRPPGWAFHRFDPRRAHARILLALIAGAALVAWMPRPVSLAVRAVTAWDAGTIVYLGLAWALVVHADAAETRRRAAAEDPGRNYVWLLVLLASVIGLFASALVLRRARSLAPTSAGLLAGLCLVAVANAWALTHTSYALRYAHLYYRDGLEEEGGLELPGGAAPGMVDFAYFAFTIGMCFQVSDVTVSSQKIRASVLGHAVLSFVYNTVIVALTLNVMFGFV